MTQPCCTDTIGTPVPCQHGIRVGQKRRTVEAVTLGYGPRGKAVVSTARLSCGHVAFRKYHVAVGQTAYCAPCGEVLP